MQSSLKLVPEGMNSRSLDASWPSAIVRTSIGESTFMIFAKTTEWSHRRLLVLLTVARLGAPVDLPAAVSRDFVVDLKATVSGSSPHIVLSWTQRLQANITGQEIHRRVKGESAWVLQATLATTQTNYADATAVTGVQYEYWMKRTFSGVNPTTALGYICAGVNLPMVEDRGKLLLLVDDTMAAPLASEISQLQQDLAGDGWTVQVISAVRTNTPPQIRALIQAAYNADPTNVRMAYLLGHVPVPYSGEIAPDGHGDHVGAWPADGYYGDLDGTWTDTTVDRTTASRAENDNVPGDGKFDQSNFPSLLELGIGRVDMKGMTYAPASSVTETALLRRYLRKAHEYRHRLGAYADIPRRTLMRDGFGHAFSSEPFAISGWALGFSGAGLGSYTPIDEAPSMAWFLPGYAGSNSYLVGYGCGGGSYQSASSVGNTSDFGRRPSKVVFTALFGSYHGDWDAANCFLRAPLAGNATDDSLGLACYWAGRPNWFMYHMGMGETVGYSAWVSMNNRSSQTDYTPDGSSVGGVHLGLMGDPALRLHMVEPPRRLTAGSSGGQVQLRWLASTETNLLGYHVYRGASATGPFDRLTPSPQMATNYTDSSVITGSNYSYLVRTVKLESAPGGTYQNLSCGSLATLIAGTTTPLPPTGLALAQGAGASVQLTWEDNASDETGFRIERKTNGDGTYAPVGTNASDDADFVDPGPFAAGNVYYYRVIATGPADSPPSNEVSFEAVSGYFDMAATRIKVAKNAGSATILVNRFGGNAGTATVNYATANLSATGGVHYTATSGSLMWTNGESAPKAITVPIINTPSPQLPRQFKVNLTGTGVGVANYAAVLIEDTAATLAAPWSQTMLGSLTDSSPAVSAEGAIGDATIGGSGVTSGDTSESGRFVYQSRTGDGVMTAFVPDGFPSQTGARFAVMARGALSGGSAMAASVTSGDAGAYGAKLACRTNASGAAILQPGANNNHRTPRWLRLTRAGNAFFAESSADGTSWTLLGSESVPLPATCYWGLFHYSADIAISSTYLGDYQLGRFQNINFMSLDPPGIPTGLVVNFTAPDGIQLGWATVYAAAGYRIERRDETGAFSQIADIAAVGGATQTFNDDTVAPDSGYEYRITPYNGTGDGGSVSITSATPRPDNIYTMTTDGDGNADATIRYTWPDTSLGSSTKLTVAGTALGTHSPTTLQKIYLRFNLASIPSVLKSAVLKLSYMSSLRVGTGFYMSISLLDNDASDNWNESTITYNNAPQNDADDDYPSPPTLYCGAYWLSSNSPAPPYGGVVAIDIDAGMNRGANGLVTLAMGTSSESNLFEWASREHPTFSPPTLVLTETSPLPTRPSFLSAPPTGGGGIDPAPQAGGGGIDIGWADNSDNETGFELERRALNGTFVLLQSLAQDTTAFFDSSALAGVTYEYRVRATGVAGNSSWTPIVTATAPGTATPYQLWLQANGLPMDGSGSGAPEASPAGDAIGNLTKYALGLNPWNRGYDGRLTQGKVADGGLDYLSLTYIRPEPRPADISYVVEASSNLETWDSSVVVQVSDVPVAGTRVITVRDGVATRDAARRFLRLRVNQP